MLNFTLLRLFLLRLGRLSRRKWLIFLGTCLIIFLTSFLILDSILLIINQFTNFYHWLDCLSGKMLARQEACRSYEKEKIAGNLCSDWCSGSSSVLQSCPTSTSFHVGKECIFLGQWKESNIIVKAKKLKAAHMVDEDMKLTREETVQGIHSIITTAFEGTEIDPSYLTIPWFGSPVKLSSLTNKELNSLWTLAQDNEYIYSTFFGQLTQWNSVKVLPQVLGTCGHFYAVEYIPETIQFFDVIPEKSSLHTFKHSFSRRLFISHMLLKFLYNLESGNYNLQLCDVKYDQFAIKNGTIMLIDSDMLYPSEIVAESIQHIDSCIKDEDCDFIDCKGRCKPSKFGDTCEIDDSDNNLKRICRNLFFIDEISPKRLPKSSSQINAGLLSHFPLLYQSDIYKLKQLCSEWMKEPETISTITTMIDLTSAMQSRTHPLHD